MNEKTNVLQSFFIDKQNVTEYKTEKNSHRRTLTLEHDQKYAFKHRHFKLWQLKVAELSYFQVAEVPKNLYAPLGQQVGRP